MPAGEFSAIRLNNSVELPLLGLGTFKAKGESVRLAVQCALAEGIRHIDTASIYKNEEDIAMAISSQGLPRSQIFITSKVSPYQQGRDKATTACEEILSRLQTDYVDLLLIHWPGVAKVDAKSAINSEKRRETWQVLEEQLRRGRARAIGVSNYDEVHLRELLTYAAVPPAVNQFEVHPRRPCKELRAFCDAAGIAVVAYASLGCGELLQHPLVNQVAAAVERTPAQVLLRWALQQGCAVIPKSVHPEYIKQCSEQQLLTWELTQGHLELLNTLADGHKYCWDPAGIA